jgi:hypothetical protein
MGQRNHEKPKMSTRKNHHFVPQFYFRFFSGDSRSISVLHRHTGRVIASAPIRGQACKAWFYGDDIAEDALSQVEGACSAALRELAALRNPADLPAESVELVLIWLALQRSRTKAARQSSQPMHDRFAQLWAEVELRNDEDISPETRDLLLGNLDAVRVDPVGAQRLMMSVAVETASSLGDMTPIFLLNKTNRPFIFGDAPVVLYNSLHRETNHRGVLGFSAAGLMVFLPIGPSKILLLLDAASYRLRRVIENRIQVRDLRDVSELNKLQIHAATDCVYFGDFARAPYVAELWRQERSRLCQHACEVIQAPSFSVETGEPLGDIVHSFQPQLPYRLSLSFLEPLGNSQRTLLRRNLRPSDRVF